ncbi:hypothetical protein [Vreelandella jeotgali]|uniref:hypothetical protein n=1 Tax=Vreelandella jeotgali TaxID=553386 RepID=UPI00034C2174|nr:hypothetical protein [Halomonas jeotgali]
MRLEINSFGGMVPLVKDLALSDKFGSYACNVRFDKGVLSPGSFKLKDAPDYPYSKTSGTGIRSVAKLFEDGTRLGLSEPEGSEAFPSPLEVTDKWGRVYFMSGSGPSFSTTDNYSPGQLNINPISYRLGVEPPDDAPRADVTSSAASTSASGGGDEGGGDSGGDGSGDGSGDGGDGSGDDTAEDEGGDADEVDVAYIYAFVDKYGHEGPPSPPSDPVTVFYDVDFSVALRFPSQHPHGGNYTGGLRRVYRASYDGSSSAWQFLIDIPITEKAHSDSLPVGEEGEQLVSEDWNPAPRAMRSLCLVASSFAAGMLEHHLRFSELKLPHAWPEEYSFPLKYSPVKLLPMNNGLLVLTSGRPYWAEGTDPGSAIPRELPINAPCLSPESVVDVDGVAMYMSPDGIIAVSQAQGQLVSASFIDRAGVADLVDEGCTAFSVEGRYVFSTADGRWMSFTTDGGFVEHKMGYSPGDFRSVTFSVRDNRHYFAFRNGQIRTVDLSSNSDSAEWVSKVFHSTPVSFSAMRLEADSYPVPVEVIASSPGQDDQTFEFEVGDAYIHRLPCMFGTHWKLRVKVPDDNHVHRAVMAQSGLESA